MLEYNINMPKKDGKGKPGPKKGALKNKPKNFYPQETKDKAVKDLSETEMRTVDFDAVAKKYGCSPLSLKSWAQKARVWQPNAKKNWAEEVKATPFIEAAPGEGAESIEVKSAASITAKAAAFTKAAKALAKYDGLFEEITNLEQSIVAQQKQLAEKKERYMGKQSAIEKEYNVTL